MGIVMEISVRQYIRLNEPRYIVGYANKDGGWEQDDDDSPTKDV
jgi:hypothetical protein